MKSLFLILPLVTLTGASFAQTDGKNESSDATVGIPVPNYWDANTWESGSGATFWRAKKEPTSPGRGTTSTKSK